jgi:hypothetical protein
MNELDESLKNTIRRIADEVLSRFSYEADFDRLVQFLANHDVVVDEEKLFAFCENEFPILINSRGY